MDAIPSVTSFPPPDYLLNTSPSLLNFLSPILTTSPNLPPPPRVAEQPAACRQVFSSPFLEPAIMLDCRRGGDDGRAAIAASDSGPTSKPNSTWAVQANQGEVQVSSLHDLGEGVPSGLGMGLSNERDGGFVTSTPLRSVRRRMVKELKTQLGMLFPFSFIAFLLNIPLAPANCRSSGFNTATTAITITTTITAPKQH